MVIQPTSESSGDRKIMLCDRIRDMQTAYDNSRGSLIWTTGQYQIGDRLRLAAFQRYYVFDSGRISMALSKRPRVGWAWMDSTVPDSQSQPASGPLEAPDYHRMNRRSAQARCRCGDSFIESQVFNPTQAVGKIRVSFG